MQQIKGDTMAEIQTDPTYLKIPKEFLTQAFGEWFIPADKISHITAGPELKPVFFANMSWRKIFHDSPAIGAMEYGDTIHYLDGPFANEEEANAAAEKKKSKDLFNHEFWHSIIKRFYPAENFPPKLESLICEQYSIDIDREVWNLRKLNRPGLSGTPNYSCIVKALPKCYETLCKRIMGIASEYSQEEERFKSFNAVVSGTLIEGRIIHYEKKETSNIKIRNLFKEADKKIELIVPILETLDYFDIPVLALEITLWGRYFALPPVKDFSAEQGIDKYIETNKLVRG